MIVIPTIQARKFPLEYCDVDFDERVNGCSPIAVRSPGSTRIVYANRSTTSPDAKLVNEASHTKRTAAILNSRGTSDK